REKQAIENKFQRECAAIKQELKEREDQLVQDMLKEIDDRIQSIKDEADALDIEGPARTTSSTNRKGQHVGKQEKRRHDPTTSTAKKRGTRKPAIIPLLPEHIIAEDVKLLAPAECVTSAGEHHNVRLSKGKLIYDRKHYKRGEDVVVQAETSAAFPGRILAIHKRYIQIISTVPGVTREVLATMADLRNGLVILRNRIV
ncbi:hypothetical protein Angca_001907, partial [Angiostrongylus cantonensis]